jgi:hypothetical protein
MSEEKKPFPLQKVVALLCIISTAVAIEILVMIYGWGLHVRSWAWIVILGIVGLAFVRLLGDEIMKW